LTVRPAGTHDDPFDLLIIGGGINGAGVARDAARRGLSVALFEKTDFGYGATGASSGMIHGGARYLQSDPKVTELACVDSGYIQKIAQHLIFRIPFILPMLRGRGQMALLKGAEVYFEAYNRYQPKKGGQRSCRLSVDELRHLEPGITKRVIGAVTTDEWGIDAARLNLINALDAAEHGADLNTYHEVIGVLSEGGKVRGLKVRARLTASTREVFGKAVLNATGAWAGRTAALAGNKRKLVRPGKGIHLVFPGRITNYAIVSRAIDGRDIFISPQQNETWIGTTDDDYWGDLDDIPVLEDEIKYLMNGIERVLPSIRKHRIFRTMVGCRPTLYEYGKGESKLSRGHRLFEHDGSGCAGLFSLGGGKLASYRAISEEVTDTICKRLGVTTRCETHSEPLPGGDDHDLTAAAFAEVGVDAYAAERILFRHGSRADRILDLLKDEPRTRAIICGSEPITEAELRYAIRSELVGTLSDLKRRIRLGAAPCGGSDCVFRAAQIFCDERGLSARDAGDVARSFAADLWRDRSNVAFGSQLAQEQLGQARWFLSGNLGAANTRPMATAAAPQQVTAAGPSDGSAPSLDRADSGE
jgi:glycerol-3-phosphate dehydrogenase